MAHYDQEIAAWLPDVGESWDGRGPHEGHRITLLQVMDPPSVVNGILCSVRVGCTCGEEWWGGGLPTIRFEGIDGMFDEL